MSRVVTHAGVLARHIARPDQTALDLAVVACNRLFERNPELSGVVDGIVFCTQTPDYIMPPNACVLHRALGLNESVFCCDTNLACSGFVYSLTLAEGLISSGTCANVLLVTADTYSKLIHPGDRSTRTLFGDGAAVSWIAASNDTRGVVDILCETSGAGFERFYVPAGGWRNPRSSATAATKQLPNGNLTSDEHINMDGMGVLAFVKSKIPDHIRRLLDRNQLTTTDIDLFVFHQASRLALEMLAGALKLPSEKVFNNLAEVGNTVSASIPIGLSEALATERLRQGNRVLICGFGVGLSWASAVMEV